jgi:hypothetical protein
MFEQLDEPKRERRTDWTGTLIGIALLPVFVVFVWLDKAEMGFTVTIILGMIVLAIKLQWKLRKHIWFWATIAVVLAIHVPLIFIVRWPDTRIPTIAYSMPLGIADFLVISGAIALSKMLFLKGSSSGDDDKDQ